MNMDTYSKKAIGTLLGDHALGDIDARLTSQVFGLVGESGEIAEKFKKLIRDKHGVMSEEDTKEILKELGDVLWYVNSIAFLLGSDLETVAHTNLDKLASRQSRGVMQGSGDNR